MIEIRFGTLIAENVLKMVRAKRTAVFPLRITGPISFTNGNPAISGIPIRQGPLYSLFKPRNHQRGFRLELTMSDVVVRQRTVKWVQLRNKCHRNVISPRARLGIIISAIIRRPIKVPGTFVVWNWIIASGLFSNPKHRGHDIGLPRDNAGPQDASWSE